MEHPHRFAALAAFAAMLAVVPALAPPAAAVSLTDLAAAIDQPAWGPVVTLDGPVVLGRGRLFPGAGARVRLLLAAGEPCGLWIDGPVRLDYAVDDRFSRPVAEKNLERASSRRATVEGGVLKVGGSFDGAVVWGWELAAAISGGAAKAGAEAGGGGGSGLPIWAAEILTRPFFPPPSTELIAARRLGAAGVAYALLDGGREPWLIAVDPGVDRLEAIWALEKLPAIYTLSKGRHLAHELVSQPIGRPWWEHGPAPAVAKKEAIRVDVDKSDLVTVTTRSRIEATRAGVGLWRVSLLDRTIVRDVEVPVRALAVTVGGQPVEFLHQGSELLVPLDPPLAAGKTADVEVVNAGRLAVRPGNDSYWVLSIWPWYPQPSFNGEMAEIEIEVRVPDPFIPFASGTTVERAQGDGFATLRTRLDQPTMFPVVAAGKYKLYSDQRAGVTCNVASYVFGKEKEAQRLTQLFFAGADIYGKLFGVPYPFPELDIVEINSWGFGQAPAGVIFITQEAYNPLSSETSRAFSGGVNERILHEVAHGWWGHVIKMDSVEEQWLTESFAEYSAALALRAMAGGKAGDREFASLLRGWVANAKQIRAGGSIYLANHLAGDSERDQIDRIYLLYAKGPVVLHALRQELARVRGSVEEGDRYFFALLRSFVKNFQGGWGATSDLVGILNQITGSDWQPWFERYVYGTETPAVKE